MGKGKAKRSKKEKKCVVVQEKRERPSYAQVLKPIENIPKSKKSNHKRHENEKKSFPTQSQLKSKSRACSSISAQPSEINFPPLVSPRHGLPAIMERTSTTTDTKEHDSEEQTFVKLKLENKYPLLLGLKGSASMLGQLFLLNHLRIPRPPMYILFPPPPRRFITNRPSSRITTATSVNLKFGLIGAKKV